MFNRFNRQGGYGRGGGGGGMGLGFRGSSPPWPYVGRGRGGLPRCGYYFGTTTPAAGFNQPGVVYSGYTPYTSRTTKQDDLNYMKDRAEAIKEELANIESRMHDLENEK